MVTACSVRCRNFEARRMVLLSTVVVVAFMSFVPLPLSNGKGFLCRRTPLETDALLHA